MLISKITKVKWNGRTRKWYESKGYIFTKWNEEFEVKCEDLLDGSYSLVNIACDCEDCTTPIDKPKKWKDYLKSIHKDGKYYCRNCAYKLFAGKTRTKNALKNGENSFAQSLINEYGFDAVDKFWDKVKNIDKDGNKIDPWKINKSCSTTIWIICQEKEYHGSYVTSCNDFSAGNRCPYCTTRHGKSSSIRFFGAIIKR